MRDLFTATMWPSAPTGSGRRRTVLDTDTFRKEVIEIHRISPTSTAAGAPAVAREPRTQDFWPYAAPAERAILNVAPADKEIGSGTRSGNWCSSDPETHHRQDGAAASRPVNTGRRVSFLRVRRPDGASAGDVGGSVVDRWEALPLVGGFTPIRCTEMARATRDDGRAGRP